ncbi:MAG: M14 family metallopeptidase, partial [Gemmatimonadaceae bacterium]
MSTPPADFILPELTRSLRALGSARWLRDADHARFLTPLLTARRNAARVRTAEGQVAAFQADRLRRAFTDAVEQMAAARHPRSAPERRAYAARVSDAGSAVWGALDALEAAAARVATASAAARADAWHAWVSVLQQLFLACDGWWQRVVELRDGVRHSHITRALVLLLLAAVPALAGAQQHLTYRVTGVRPESLLVRGFDVVGAEQGAALVVAEQRDVTRLLALGAQAELRLAPNTDARRLRNLAVAASPVVYRSYDDPQRGIRAWVDSLAAANPRVSVDTVGSSYEGRPILAVKVGPRGDAADRPNVLFVATHHAREWAATEMALRLIRLLATATDARTDSLVNKRDVWIVPVVNPDGYQYTFTNDRLWRKNRHPYGQARGVDLNRNHSTAWGLDDIGSSPDPFSEIYRGPSPASEPEVKALQQFHLLHPPVVSISYHTYAGLLLFPPGSVSGVLSADLDVYRALAGTNANSAVRDRLPGSQRSFYSPGMAWLLYPTNGEYTDWASTTLGTVSVNPELTSGYGTGGYYGFEFPDDEALLQQLFTDNLPFALDAIEMARDPANYRSATTGLRPERWVLESGSTRLRVRGPKAGVVDATLDAAGRPVDVLRDVTSIGRYGGRISSQSGAMGRPAAITVKEGGEQVGWSLLAAAGAESGDPAWSMTDFALDSAVVFAGKASYRGTSGELRSTPIKVPANVDTLSLSYWTRYSGDGYSELPFAWVRYSPDNG